MPFLHWLERDKTIKKTNKVPYRLLEVDSKLSCSDHNFHNLLNFLVQLNDGRILVVEYKGSQFAGGDDAEEKELIGKVWADKSDNLFLMAWKKNDKGSNIGQQIKELFEYGNT